MSAAFPQAGVNPAGMSQAGMSQTGANHIDTNRTDTQQAPSAHSPLPFDASQSQAMAAAPAAQRASFADEVRGRDAQGIDLTLAKLMRDVYDYDRNGRQEGIPGWRPMQPDELRAVGIDPNDLANTTNGLKSVIYTDDKGRHVLAFSGTDEPKDWLTNLRQGLGFEDAQYNQAMAVARQAKAAFGQDLVITGHSLGGGLAVAAAYAADAPAVTFNASGVHGKTLERIGLDRDAVVRDAEGGNVRRYAVDNEILTGLQERTPIVRGLMPDAIGYKIELQDPDPLKGWSRLNPIKHVKHSVELHYIDAVIDSMERTYGKDFDTRNAMSHATHPASAHFAHVLPAVQATAGEHPLLASAGQQQAFAGAVVNRALERDIDPQRIGGVRHHAPSGETFVMLGQGESQHVGLRLPTAETAQTPLAQSSEQARQAMQAHPALAPAPQAAPALAAMTAPETPESGVARSGR